MSPGDGCRILENAADGNGEIRGCCEAASVGTVDLAECDGHSGVLSLDFTDAGRAGELFHGNELLFSMDSNYPQEELRRVPQHSVGNIIEALDRPLIHVPGGHVLPAAITRPRDLFLGYLMLDALIGNTDRHHENWGILVCPAEEGQARRADVAPSFDHASSLGRELREEERAERLNTQDAGFSIQSYARKAVSAIYGEAGQKRPLSTVDAFRRFAEHCPAARQAWLDKLGSVSENSLSGAVNRVPADRLTDTSGRFVLEVLRFNRKRLLEK
ncbi:hypothetical protein LCGC14_1856980 [marine sediment metagenome]|uniref:HipA-like C-terminal domain-containing protein n=1 Tax=marine sediment metagenome TaxID=412755 RepID=A0A0F9J7R6_9ZZZZ